MKALGTILAALTLILAMACTPPDEEVAQTPVTTVVVDPLPSWADGQARQSILDFVARITDEDSADFVPEPERIAVFDNDGTLWAEQPLYFQLLFPVDLDPVDLASPSPFLRLASLFLRRMVTSPCSFSRLDSRLPLLPFQPVHFIS